MKKTHEQFLKDFEIKGNKNLIIYGIYQGCNTPISVKCKECNEIFNSIPHTLLKGCGCPYCTNRKVKKDLNSFGIKHPELLQYFINREDAFKYSLGSKNKALLQCPICKTKFTIAYYILNKQGINCPICNTASYPNKFLRLFLNELSGITNLSFEKVFKYNDTIIRYDAIFNYQDNKFAIEINGGQHYKNCSFNNYNVQEQQNKDLFKKSFAENQNMKYIAIDARKSNFLFIKNNILNSDFIKYFDLTNINWDNLFKNFNNYSLLNEICNDYENNLLRIEDLAYKYNLDRHKISSYLQEGKELGLCNNYQLGANRKGVGIEAYDSNNNLIGVYPSIKICAEKLNEIYHLNFLTNSISHVLSGAQKSHRKFYFRKVS